MRPFEHVEPRTTRTAIDYLAGDPQARPISGGTDLLPLMKLGIVQPRRVVNLKPLAELRYVHHDARGGLRIGALTTLDEIERHPVVRERFPALAQAIGAAATPQLRNVGTIGGNLCQHSRCWYYREDFNCWLKGGEICFARSGENAFHSIFRTTGPCVSTQPSDVAPVIVALDGSVRVRGSRGERTVPAAEFFIIPHEGDRQLTLIAPDELVVEVQVPEPPAGQRTLFLKAMDREVWAFALASVALALRLEGGRAGDIRVADARLVLGGVAPTPWRAHAAEAALRGKTLDTGTIATCAREAVEGAQPLADNGYKVALVEGLVKRALELLAEAG